MKPSLHFSLLVILFLIGMAGSAGALRQSDLQSSAAPSHPNFHDAPSADPLPPVLDPSQFLENRAAFVAYGLASKIPQTLYQVPCYCGCDRHHDHQSLHDCFTGNHGTHCRICQKEAVFCFLQQKKGKTPSQIREAMERGAVTNLNLDKYVRRYYPQLRKSQQ
jgi:hypothetical protein